MFCSIYPVRVHLADSIGNVPYTITRHCLNLVRSCVSHGGKVDIWRKKYLVNDEPGKSLGKLDRALSQSST